MAKEYRSRSRILYDLLKAVKDEPGIATTRLLFLGNLSHERLKEYVGEMVAKGWVEEAVAPGEERRRSHRITGKGQAVLAELDRVRRVMEDFGLGL